jgi:hypothetical protein
MSKLTPPDFTRCQAEAVQRTPFALGGTHKRTRCDSAPTVIAIERKPGSDGRTGSMSLCPDCLEIMKQQLGADHCLIAKIKPNRARGQ